MGSYQYPESVHSDSSDDKLPPLVGPDCEPRSSTGESSRLRDSLDLSRERLQLERRDSIGSVNKQKSESGPDAASEITVLELSDDLLKELAESDNQIRFSLNASGDKNGHDSMERYPRLRITSDNMALNMQKINDISTSESDEKLVQALDRLISLESLTEAKDLTDDDQNLVQLIDELTRMKSLLEAASNKARSTDSESTSSARGNPSPTFPDRSTGLPTNVPKVGHASFSKDSMDANFTANSPLGIAEVTRKPSPADQEVRPSRAAVSHDTQDEAQFPAEEKNNTWTSTAKSIITGPSRVVGDWLFGSSSSKPQESSETKEKEKEKETLALIPETSAGTVSSSTSAPETSDLSTATKSSEEFKEVHKEIHPLQKDWVVVGNDNNKDEKEKNKK